MCRRLWFPLWGFLKWITFAQLFCIRSDHSPFVFGFFLISTVVLIVVGWSRHGRSPFVHFGIEHLHPLMTRPAEMLCRKVPSHNVFDFTSYRLNSTELSAPRALD